MICISRVWPSLHATRGGKLIQKALDRRHAAAIRQFAKAKDENALRELWEEALKRGDIPGAYWAVLSHPAATEAIMRKVSGDVHMLSHMVGAANRADIRRLCQLEEQNAALSPKVEDQQLQLCAMALPGAIIRSGCSTRCCAGRADTRFSRKYERRRPCRQRGVDRSRSPPELRD
jgi:hypothetical protein